MGLIFYFKMFQSLYRFGKHKKFLQNVFGIFDNCVTVTCGKFSLSWQEYLPSPVNMLTNSLKISNLTKREVFQLNLSQIDE